MRLRESREASGYASAAAAARALNISRFTYAQHENGIREIPRDAAIRYARFYRVSLEWLLTGKGSRGSPKRVPVVGKVGAGAAVYPFDDYPPGEGAEMVDAPPDAADSIAVRIEGDSLFPFQDGWLLFYSKDQDGVPEECIGKLCICKVADGGPTLAKTLRRGSKKGVWRLESWNAAPKEDVKLEWAARVLYIKPT